MLKLAILAILAATAQAGTYTCSLFIADIAQPTITTPTSCQAGVVGGPFASASPGSLVTTGSSFTSNLFATASMVDSVTVSGASGMGIFAYLVQSSCPTAAGFCIGDGPGWRFVPFTFGVPIPISLSIQNSDSNVPVPPAMLGVQVQITTAAALQLGTSQSVTNVPGGLERASIPGAFLLSGPIRPDQFVAAPVPEPANLALAGLALLAVLGMRGRRTIHSGRQ